jgi:hypothetical protein
VSDCLHPWSAGPSSPELSSIIFTGPPLSQARLTRRADGRLELELKRVWRDGTRALVLEPFDLLTRLAAVPPFRASHLLRYFGVLSSHSSLR